MERNILRAHTNRFFAVVSRRSCLTLYGKCIFEKLVIEQPCRIEVPLPGEACYVFLRSGSVIINGAELNARLAPRDGIALNCGEYIADFCEGVSGPESEVIAVHLDPDVLRAVFLHDISSFLKSGSAPLTSPIRVSNDVMDRFVESLVFYFDNVDIVTDAILVLKIRELVFLLVQSSHAGSVMELFSTLFTRRAVSVSEVVNAHLFHNLSIEELSKLAGLSVTAFKLEAKRLFGDPPAAYIRKKKIERAKELLRLSNYSIGDVAEAVGYNDLSHFSRSFQAECGVSPTAFRSQAKAA